MNQRLLDSIDQQTRLAGHNRLALLVFRVHGDALYGINVFKVLEVMRTPRITWVPGANAVVRGVADVRGKVIPVLDLAAVLGAAGDDAGDSYLIVTEYNRTLQGFLVGGIERIVHLDVSEVLPPDEQAAYLTAITRIEGRWVQILDVEQVLSEVSGGPPALDSRFGEAPARRECRALVVDDSRVARNQVNAVLSQLGIQSVLLQDGRQAIEWLRAQAAAGADPVTLVISDIEMPHMDGYSLVTEIRRDPALQSLYLILHTSLSGQFNRAMVDQVGANDFIAKFSPDELADAVLRRLGQVA